MSGVQTLTLSAEADGQRLDRWLKRTFPQLTQGRVEKMCRKGELRINGGRVKASTRLEEGQTLRVPPLPPEMPSAPGVAVRAITDADAEMIQRAVIFKDEDMIAINKPPGLASQGGTGTTRHVDMLSDALRFEGKAATGISKAFQSKSSRKIYWAAVAGCPAPRIGTIRYGLVKAGGYGVEKMICIHPMDIENHEGAKRATTDYKVLEAAGKRVTWVALVPITGRTHQLRAHMAEIGHPIIGDGKYGHNSSTNEGDGWGAQLGGDISKKLHLHARTLMFDHPSNGSRVVLNAGMPEHMTRTWEMMAWEPKEHTGDPFEEEL